MSKREKKQPSPQESKDQSPSSESSAAPAVPEAAVIEEQILKLVDAMNQQMKFVESLAERTMKIEQSLAGLGEALKSAARPGGGGDNPLLQMVLAGVAREFGGGGEAEKLIKTFADNYMKIISPDAQRTMFKDMVAILREGIRMGKAGVSESATKSLPGGETE